MKGFAVWTGIAVASVLVLWGLLHVLISPVNPIQEPPDGHATAPCWVCHFVSESAEVREP